MFIRATEGLHVVDVAKEMADTGRNVFWALAAEDRPVKETATAVHIAASFEDAFSILSADA